MREKIRRIRFSGRGLFSSINVFTTRLAMIDAIEIYGLGGDGMVGKDDIRDSLQAPPLYQEEKL